jgi:hypothetical protein
VHFEGACVFLIYARAIRKVTSSELLTKQAMKKIIKKKYVLKVTA